MWALTAWLAAGPVQGRMVTVEVRVLGTEVKGLRISRTISE